MQQSRPSALPEDTTSVSLQQKCFRQARSLSTSNPEKMFTHRLRLNTVNEMLVLDHSLLIKTDGFFEKLHLAVQNMTVTKYNLPPP